jgi:hypothetical protein
MSVYSAFGLSIRSDVLLSGLLPGDRKPDVAVLLRKLPPPPPRALAQGYYFQASPQEVHLFWDDVGSILVREGREIIIDLLTEAVQVEVQRVLTGPAMAILIHQREGMPLHASGVMVGGGAWVFLGDSGTGKSTMAAAFYSRGYPLVADDLIALSFNGSGPPSVFPAFPQLRLLPGEVFPGSELEPAQLAYPPDDKGTYCAERGFPRAPLPLRSIHVLVRGRTLAIEPLGPQEAMVELLRHTYRISLMHPFRGPANFLNCVRLVQEVPVYRLSVPPSLAGSGAMVEKVLRALDALGRPEKPAHG